VTQAQISDPANAIWVMDSIGSEIWREDYVDYRNNPQQITNRHNEGFNAAFGDGHVKWIRFRNSKPCQWSIQDDPCFSPGQPGVP
jgi:prepilin-type processing-associated H-X9-DG protein